MTFRCCIISVFSFTIISTSFSTYANDAATNTGNELITICNSHNYSTNNSLWSYCLGYVTGVTDGQMFAIYNQLFVEDSKKAHKYISPTNNEIFSKMDTCMPNNVTRAQMGLVVSKYLKDNPAKLNILSAQLVYEALSEAWPCPKYKETKPVAKKH